jgi:hypothetical protein
MNIKSQLCQGIGNSDYIAASSPLIIVSTSYYSSFQNHPECRRLWFSCSNRQISYRATFLNFCHPTFHVLPPVLQVFLEAESVVVAELSPEVVVWAAESVLVFEPVLVAVAEPVLAAESFLFAEPV